MAIDLTLPPSCDSARFAADRSLRLAKAVHCRVIELRGRPMEDPWKTMIEPTIVASLPRRPKNRSQHEPTTQRKRLDAWLGWLGWPVDIHRLDWSTSYQLGQLGNSPFSILYQEGLPAEGHGDRSPCVCVLISLLRTSWIYTKSQRNSQSYIILHENQTYLGKIWTVSTVLDPDTLV